eukprot:GHVS01077161.1.p1 GENE.GHVS01077161.1~~GHVS01077161.1.p1  ORF type:complete len:128 (+),score=12.28 GHVS01077161.1:223-606(+)
MWPIGGSRNLSPPDTYIGGVCTPPDTYLLLPTCPSVDAAYLDSFKVNSSRHQNPLGSEGFNQRISLRLRPLGVNHVHIDAVVHQLIEQLLRPATYSVMTVEIRFLLGGLNCRRRLSETTIEPYNNRP